MILLLAVQILAFIPVEKLTFERKWGAWQTGLTCILQLDVACPRLPPVTGRTVGTYPSCLLRPPFNATSLLSEPDRIQSRPSSTLTPWAAEMISLGPDRPTRRLHWPALLKLDPWMDLGTDLVRKTVWHKPLLCRRTLLKILSVPPRCNESILHRARNSPPLPPKSDLIGELNACEKTKKTFMLTMTLTSRRWSILKKWLPVEGQMCLQSSAPGPHKQHAPSSPNSPTKHPSVRTCVKTTTRRIPVNRPLEHQ